MATKKKTSFLHLELELEEEDKFRAMLRDRDLKGKQVLRTLVRMWLSGKVK